MTLHPEVQYEAQREIWDVVGSDRLPSLTDRERLTYIDALVKEVLRFNPVANLGERSSIIIRHILIRARLWFRDPTHNAKG